ncbi:MAG: hypothetical protein HZA46_05785 [Planctomycetales bacterium]|nr:hypothetical protein [Planctomycetales bacterium]
MPDLLTQDQAEAILESNLEWLMNVPGLQSFGYGTDGDDRPCLLLLTNQMSSEEMEKVRLRLGDVLISFREIGPVTAVKTTPPA